MSDDPGSVEALEFEQRRSIVERLRFHWDSMGDMANAERDQAADFIEEQGRTIERLRRRDFEADAVRELEHVKVDRNNLALAVESMQREIDRVTDERDEARRWVCNMKAASVTYLHPPEHFAQQHGWRCFDVTKGRPAAAGTDKTSHGSDSRRSESTSLPEICSGNDPHGGKYERRRDMGKVHLARTFSRGRAHGDGGQRRADD